MLNILLDPNDLLFIYLEFFIEFAYKGRLFYSLSIVIWTESGVKGRILIFYLPKCTFSSVTLVRSNELTAKAEATAEKRFFLKDALILEAWMP